MNNKWTRNQKILAIGVGVSVLAVIVSIGILFVQVLGLKQKIQPIIEMKPQIVNVINNITKVEKEIANIREAIHQEYAAFKIEQFGKKDLEKTIAIYPNPIKIEQSVIFFELQSIPEENSIQITDELGMSAPMITFTVLSNIICLRRYGKPDSFLKDENKYYVVKYITDAISNKKMYIIKGFKFITKGDNLEVEYQEK